MPYTQYTTAQIQYLRLNYADLAPAHFAQRWGVPEAKIYNLARRHGIKRRAPNGEPVWRERAKQGKSKPQICYSH